MERITQCSEALVSEACALYNRNFPRFAASEASFSRNLMLDDGAVMFTWREKETLAGFAVVYMDGLMMLCVDAPYRRRGIGAALLAACEKEAALYGKLILGHASSGRYLFCGAPKNKECDAFLDASGYSESAVCDDCVLCIDEFTPREYVSDCIIRMRREDEREAAYALGNSINAGRWGKVYREAKDMIVAEMSDGSIGGGVVISPGCGFEEAIEGSCTLGCLGVEKAYRRRGIAAALCHRLVELARERGYRNIFIGWTGIADWYGGLGAKRYASWRMGEKKL